MTSIDQLFSRRTFLKISSATVLGEMALSLPRRTAAEEPERLKPIGEAKGIHPGRVVWVHDPEAPIGMGRVTGIGGKTRTPIRSVWTP
ncbi:MAG: hypothetical protein FJ398_17690 [Verrucomicrobia bacterium]|nr:hypothetical protein [Verrucomicrobiota bacterium]